MADLAIKVEELERWRDGNGKKGAAATIIDHEKRLGIVESCMKDTEERLTENDLARAREKMVISEVVEAVLKKQNRTALAIFKAFFPPFAVAVSSILVAWITKG